MQKQSFRTIFGTERGVHLHNPAQSGTTNPFGARYLLLNTAEIRKKIREQPFVKQSLFSVSLDYLLSKPSFDQDLFTSAQIISGFNTINIGTGERLWWRKKPTPKLIEIVDGLFNPSLIAGMPKKIERNIAQKIEEKIVQMTRDQAISKETAQKLRKSIVENILKPVLSAFDSLVENNKVNPDTFPADDFAFLFPISMDFTNQYFTKIWWADLSKNMFSHPDFCPEVHMPMIKGILAKVPDDEFVHVITFVLVTKEFNPTKHLPMLKDIVENHKDKELKEELNRFCNDFTSRKSALFHNE